MIIALTGANGLLGSAISGHAARQGITCWAVPRSMLARHAEDQLSSALANADVVIHAAANTNVEECERNPDQCYADNFILTDNLARVAARVGTKTVFISSTGVYGSAKHLEPYREYDNAVPTTHHHRAKILAENVVLARSLDNLVVRTGWLFGGEFENPKNFVARRIDEAVRASQMSSAVYSNPEQCGVPTFSEDVATRLMDLIAQQCCGTFNCVNDGRASRLDYVQAIIKAARLQVEVLPTSAVSFNRIAKVSNNETAMNWKMEEYGFAAMPPWESSLFDYINRAMP